MSNTFSFAPTKPTGKPLRAGLWIAQLLVFTSFTLFGSMKLFMPVDQLAAMWVWPGAVPPWFLHLMGLIRHCRRIWSAFARIDSDSATPHRPGCTWLCAAANCSDNLPLVAG
ncbi:hypothetical protein [Mesorhizobium huakuii]|uniref:hypothetical protein n=1 Tax=Mesorhizobium huakuii TaxID=28104 RepID=UPI0032AF1626